MLIDGEDVIVSDWIEVRNPATPDEIVGFVPRATPRDVQAAVAVAKSAQKEWGSKSFCTRAEVLSMAIDTLRKDVEERAVLLVRENGKVLSEALGEIKAIPARQELAFGLAPELDTGKLFENANGETKVSYRPFGVVASIVPWNAPLSLGFGQLVSALLAGNAVVLKPPESCPLTLMWSVRMFAERLPRGLVNIVTGYPEEIGDALTRHPDVAKIAFTGSIPAARRIMAGAADTIKSLTLELGGNDPAVILPDLDLTDETMDRMARAVFRMSGQICMAIKRIYVPAKIEGRFLDRFSRSVDRMVLGNGLREGVTMGPLHTRKSLDRATRLVADAEAAGAEVTRLGSIDSSVADGGGYFMQPTVVTSVSDEAELIVDEQFCPAIPVSTYTDIDDAMDRANRSVFALGASIWSADVESAAKIARRFEAGTVFVNAHGTEAVNRRAPYGGMKQSGIGRKSGIEGILEYSEAQTLSTFLG
jgi:acyl-CoA reductase-like NAD-dependent aldehyde dehydrogenase